MVEQISRLLAVNGYIPHGYCISWSPTLVVTFVVSDLLIFLSYLSMPAAISARKTGGFSVPLAVMAVFGIHSGPWRNASDGRHRALSADVRARRSAQGMHCRHFGRDRNRTLALFLQALKLPSPIQLRKATRHCKARLHVLLKKSSVGNDVAKSNLSGMFPCWRPIVESCAMRLSGKHLKVSWTS